MEEEIFTFDDIEKLMEKIHKIKNQKCLIEIKNIIVKYNPKTTFTNNKNGIFLRFDNLSNETYKKLNAYIKKIINASTIRKLSEISMVNLTDTDNDNENNYNIDDPKYSNKEKNIIKRVNYDKQFQNNDSVFIKKNTK
jgi:hypothetical protein